jgi:hypothetical protein
MQHMFEWYRATTAELRERGARLDPDTLSPADARAFALVLEEMKRAVEAIQTGVIGRVDRAGAWAGSTARSTEEWVATATGVSWGEAKGRVELAGALHQLPDTASALVEGRISGSQAGLVARAASVDPQAEYRMLDLADRSSVKELKDAAQRVVAAASGQTDEEQAAVHRTRFLRTWTGTDGAFHLQGRMTKADGAKVLAVLEPLMEIEFTNARRQGRRESPDAYRADALVALAARGSLGSGRRAAGSAEAPDEHATPATAEGVEPRPTAHVIVRVDHAALLRGHVEGDETCEIDGLGPVPVSDVERLMSDPILTVLRIKGTQVLAASTSTRVIRRSLRQAIEQRDRVCVVPGCGIASGLEIDHLVPFAKGGPTSIENLQPLQAPPPTQDHRTGHAHQVGDAGWSPVRLAAPHRRGRRGHGPRGGAGGGAPAGGSHGTRIVETTRARAVRGALPGYRDRLTACGRRSGQTPGSSPISRSAAAIAARTRRAVSGASWATMPNPARPSSSRVRLTRGAPSSEASGSSDSPTIQETAGRSSSTGWSSFASSIERRTGSSGSGASAPATG